MGSYLSIRNDTPNEWQATIGPDEAAVHISTIAIGCVAGAASIVASVGAAAPFTASLAAGGVVAICGVSTGSIAATCAAAATVSGVANAVTKVPLLMQNRMLRPTCCKGQVASDLISDAHAAMLSRVA